VLPVGGNRVVAVDAVGSRDYLAELERFDEEAAVGDLLADPALYFLEWLHWWREWAARGHLKEPVMAATLKALRRSAGFSAGGIRISASPAVSWTAESVTQARLAGSTLAGRFH
jgi:hypothetical protein